MFGEKWMWVRNSNRSGVPDFKIYFLDDFIQSRSIPLLLIKNDFSYKNWSIIKI